MMNPFDLPGPQFLQLYVLLLIVGGALAAMLRWMLRTPGAVDPSRELMQLDPYEIAYLSGGEALAVQAAIASLVHTGALEVKSSERALYRTGKEVDLTHPLERAIYSGVDPENGRSIRRVQDDARIELEKIRSRLMEAGLLLNDAQAWLVRLAPALILDLVAVIGLIKVVVGILRNRPVIFLILLCVATGALMFLFLKRPLRTRAGDAVLKRLRREAAALKQHVRTNPDGLAHDDLATAVALFGLGVLSIGAYSGLVSAMQPPGNSGGGGSRLTCSSCGSSCGGGGGCGGCGGCGGD